MTKTIDIANMGAYFPTYSTREGAHNAADVWNMTSKGMNRVYQLSSGGFVVGPTGTAPRFRRLFPSIAITLD